MNENEIAAGLGTTPGYRYADVIGDRLVLAGQVPHDRNNELVGVGDAAAQARQCLHNLFTIIEVNGFQRSDVRQLVVYVVGDHPTLSAAWSEIVAGFDGEVPPATLLGVALLGYPDQLVEIDATVLRS